MTDNEKTLALILENINLLAKKMDDGFAKIDERFAKVDERFAEVDERFDKMDKQLEEINFRLMRVEVGQSKHDRRIRLLEEDADLLTKRLDLIERRIGIK